MKISGFLFCLTAILFSGCQSDKVPESVRILHTYKESPDFIRAFIDSVADGGFRIAEKGSPWNGGCVLSGDLPCRQFISATLKNSTYRLEFLTGGFMTSRRAMVINFKDRKVLGYALEDVDGPVAKKPGTNPLPE
jgi:hypothetical protein